MSIQTWAEKEIEIACKRERADSKVEDGEWDYTVKTTSLMNGKSFVSGL